jgi:general secretion pathway protein H
MLALAILALLAALALPRARPFDGAAAIRARVYEAAALLRADRDAAHRRNRTVETAIDPGGRRLRSGAGPAIVSLPDGVSMRFSSRDAGGIRFYPEGRSSGGALAFSAAGRGLGIEIDAVTSAVRIRTLEEMRP